MSDSNADDSELVRLIGQLADNVLTDGGRVRLADLLRNDPAARAYYLDYIDLHVGLKWEHALADQADSAGAAADVGGAWPAGIEDEREHRVCRACRGGGRRLAWAVARRGRASGGAYRPRLPMIHPCRHRSPARCPPSTAAGLCSPLSPSRSASSCSAIPSSS